MAKKKKNGPKYEAAHIFVIGMILCGICTLGLSASVCMGADILSEHNEQHAANNAVMQRLFDAGCIRLKIVRSGRFKVIQTSDGDLIIGNQFRVDCLEHAGIDAKVVINWTTPDTKADGSVLFASDIKEYKIYINGQYSGAAPGESNSESVYLGSGSYEFNLTTVDVFGQESVYSKTAVVEVD